MNKVSFFSSVHTQNSTMKRKITGIINMKDCTLSLLCINVLRLFKHYLNPLFKHSQLCVRKTQRYLYSFTWESALLNLMLQTCGVSTLGQREVVDQFPPFYIWLWIAPVQAWGHHLIKPTEPSSTKIRGLIQRPSNCKPPTICLSL